MGKSSSTVTGKWYLLAFHDLLGLQADALLQLQIEDQTAWQGEVTDNATINVDALNVLGGEQDQGGVQGPMSVMFGAADQLPNAYLSSVFGTRTAAWRGFTTIAWEGGKWGANSPYAHKQSYKARFVTRMWEGGCWYPETAAVQMSGSVSGDDVVDTLSITFSAYHDGFMTHPYSTLTMTADRAEQHAILRGTLSADSSPLLARTQLTSDDGSSLYADTGWYGYEVTDLRAALTTAGRLDLMSPVGGTSSSVPVILPSAGTVMRETMFIVRANDGVLGKPQMTIVIPGHDDRTYAMNPVHILYYLQTQPGRGAEPTANMADANLKAAADWYYAQGFGLCGTRKAASVSPADYIRQIEKVAGCAFVRSPVDGKFYVNIANGEYDLESLPILTDDDVLSFKETPTVLNEAINSVSVKYFDPAKKLTVTTAPVRALALIAAFGERRQTLDYPEIPTAELANRVALRELLGFITPMRKFELDTKPTTNSYLRGQYFRLQLPKRGIADMVCEVGEIEYGKLVSGGNRLTAVQDTIKMPDAAYVGIEHGVDTRPSQIPLPVVDQRLLEAPYLEVCQQLGRAELEALPPEAGYLVAVAVDPGESRDFTLSVAPDGGAYAASGYGDFCPTATMVAATGYTDTGPLALANAKALASVQVGDPVLLEDELCRVDAIDATAMTITLGRACADTVPAKHAAGARLYFYTDHRAYSTTEYTDGELVHAKLLTNTPCRQLDPLAATAMDLTFDQRQYKPYPPAKFRVNTVADPAYLFGALTVTWVHRDRVLQADQLLDTEAASVGPEAGTTYTMRTYLDGTLDDTQTGITGTSATVTPSGNGRVRIEVESVRDSVTSLQMQVREFDWTDTEMNPLLLQSGVTVHTQTDDPIYLQG